MSVDINIKISDDRQKTTLTFGGENEGAKIDLTERELEDLIRVLGLVKWSLADGRPVPEIKGAKLKPAHQTKWAIQKDPNADETLLAFQHPGYGAVGFVLSDAQIKDYNKALQKSIKVKRALKN